MLSCKGSSACNWHHADGTIEGQAGRLLSGSLTTVMGQSQQPVQHDLNLESSLCRAMRCPSAGMYHNEHHQCQS